MKLYSDYTGRRTTQVVTDILVVVWVSIWAYAGRRVHDATLALARTGSTGFARTATR